jgi:hypothetical protein
MLPVSPDCPFWIQRKTKEQTQNGQSGDTGNIEYKTHNRENQRDKPRMDNLVIQATLSTRHTTEKNKGANPEWTIRCITGLSILGLLL